MSRIKVRMSTGAKINNIIYMSSIGMNGLFSYSIDEDELHYVMPFQGENTAYALHCGAVLHGSEVWFIPQHGKKIAIYNTESNKIDQIEIQCKNSFLSPFDKLPTISYSYGVYDDFLYILPAAIDALNIINMATREIVTIYDVIQKGECITFGVYHAGKIQAFTSDGKWRVEIDVNSGEVCRYDWNYGTISDIVWQENVNGFVIGKPGTAEILIANEDFSTVEPKRFNDGECFYGYMKQHHDEIWMYPWESTKMIKMDTNTWKRDIIDLNPIDSTALKMQVIDCDYGSAGIATANGLLYYLDEGENNWQKKYLYVESKEIAKKIKVYQLDLETFLWNKDTTCFYEKDLGLDAFLDYVER